uniref:Uncharacterized protein n=1 Tax=Timema poppense TaxID=170557 RepID=A0A7R9CI80_TIMPO|nr:unnamed protein product [Timema poppensis]
MSGSHPLEQPFPNGVPRNINELNLLYRFRSNATFPPTSSSTPVTASPHLKKRKLEAAEEPGSSKPGNGRGKIHQHPHTENNSKKYASGDTKEEGDMLEVASSFTKEEDCAGDAGAASKRRRKTMRVCDSMEESGTKSAEADSSSSQKPVVLPQKKRSLPSGGSSSTASPVRSPARKTSKSATPSSTTGGPGVVAASTTDEPVDDETLIRETEAALKSLSGSWPGPRGSFYNRGSTENEDRFDPPAFENLFEEKKVNNKMLPSSSSSTSSGCSDSSSCSLKDVITLRGQQHDSKNLRMTGCSADGKSVATSTNLSSSPTNSQQIRPAESNKTVACAGPKPNGRSSKSDKESTQLTSFQEGNELENLLKIENECETIQSQVGSSVGLPESKKTNESRNLCGGKERTDRALISTTNSSTDNIPSNRSVDYPTTSRYEPDFNELVDDSSNELEIDMSDPSGDRDDDNDSDRGHKSDGRLKSKDEINKMDERNKSHPQGSDISSSVPSTTFAVRSQLYDVPSPQSRNFQMNKQIHISATNSTLSNPSPMSPLSSSAVSFSSGSAFRAINSGQMQKDAPRITTSSIDLQSSVGAAIPPIGPFPAAATFVGYPGTVGLQGTGVDATSPNAHHSMTSLDEKAPVCILQLKPTKSEEEEKVQDSVGVEVGPAKSSLSVASPDASSKQYTILQPAGAGSRAATAIQDVTRDGVLSVSAVSSSSGGGAAPTPSNQDGKMVVERSSSASSSVVDCNRTVGPLSPSSMGRGECTREYELGAHSEECWRKKAEGFGRVWAGLAMRTEKLELKFWLVYFSRVTETACRSLAIDSTVIDEEIGILIPVECNEGRGGGGGPSKTFHKYIWEQTGQQVSYPRLQRSRSRDGAILASQENRSGTLKHYSSPLFYVKKNAVSYLDIKVAASRCNFGSFDVSNAAWVRNH